MRQRIAHRSVARNLTNTGKYRTIALRKEIDKDEFTSEKSRLTATTSRLGKRIHSDESDAWNDDFLNFRNQNTHEIQPFEIERDQSIKNTFERLVGKPMIHQGLSKVSRKLLPVYDKNFPSGGEKRVDLWIREGWTVEEQTVALDARVDGAQEKLAAAENLKAYLEMILNGESPYDIFL